MSEATVRDEIDGCIQKLCSISNQNERALKVARDSLKRIATRFDHVDYEPLVERVVTRLLSERKGDTWFMRHRLLETIPAFVMRGEKYVIMAVATFLKHENWMIRKAATEALGHLMTRTDGPMPVCGSKPGTRTNSRPASPGISVLRPANPPARPRAPRGLVIDDSYGTEKMHIAKRQQTPATTKYDDDASESKSQFLGEDDCDDAKTTLTSHSKGARSESKTSHSNFGRVGSLDTLQEEGRPDTSFSESMRKTTAGSAATLGDLENNPDDEFAIDWEDIIEELVPLIREALECKEPDIRRNALMALRKSVRTGDFHAMPLIRTSAKDEDWMCREAALLALRELTLPGDDEATNITLNLMADARREVRDAALKALETIGRPGDDALVEKLITIKEYSRAWSEKTNRPAWEIRETGVRAIGVVADLDCQHGINSLKKSLTDERIDVQRAATYAMGQVAERVVPQDMVWTYNNATAQPATKSTWLNLRWNPVRQAYVPTDGKSPSETKLKHSPRECLQALTKTPRGGAIPHLLLTPRQEHLYEGEEIQEALQLREDKRRDGEKKKAIYDLAHRIKDAIDSHDVEEVERLQKELAKFEEDEADLGSDEDGRDQRTNRTKSLASFEDYDSEMDATEDSRSRMSFDDKKSAISFKDDRDWPDTKSAVSFGVTRVASYRP